MRVFTTGQVAKLCKVAPRTVSKWFDSGRLKGFRIPGSQDRRIPENELIKFMKEHGMPYEHLLLMSLRRILLVSKHTDIADELRERFNTEEGFAVRHAQDSFQAGLISRDYLPEFVLVDFHIGFDKAGNLCSAIISPDCEFDCQIIAILPDGTRTLETALRKIGITTIFKTPFDLEDLFRMLEEATQDEDSVRKSA